MSLELSIVVPAFNEERRLSKSLQSLNDFVTGCGHEAEVLVVDDGSSDRTAQMAKDYLSAQSYRSQVLVNRVNRGKGFSVRRGLLAAQGRVVLFTDADMSAPIDEAPKLIEPIFSDNCDVAVGSRGIDRTLITQPQVFFRDWLGRSFNLAIKTITGLDIQDTQCGFKAFRTSLIQPLVESMRIDGFGFDVELLGLCAAADLRIEEIGVAWGHADGSKVDVAQDGMLMLVDSARFVARLRRGEYAGAIAAARRNAMHRA